MRNSKVKDFFKFLSKLLLCMLPLVAWFIYVMCFPSYFMDSEYPYWSQQKDYICSRHEPVDLLIIGDSAAQSTYIPKRMEGISTFNLGIGGATPVEMYYALKTYLQNNDKPKYILCSFNLSDLKYSSFFITRSVYLKYLSYSQVQEVSRIAKSLNEQDLYGRDFNLAVIGHYLCLPKNYLASVFNASFTGRKEINDAIYRDLRENFGYRTYGTAAFNHSVSTIGGNSFSCKPINQYYLEKIIEICDDNDIKFMCEPHPVNEETYDYYVRTGIKDSLEQFYRSLSDKYTNSKINCTVSAYSDDYFGDEKHLNSNGAQQLTKLFMEKMHTYGYVN